MNGLERCRNAALALVVCTACSSSIMQVGSQYAKTGVIGPAGGTLTVSASDDAAIAGTTITIPAGALSTATTIKIGQSDQAVVSSGALGLVIDFEQSVAGTVFAKPATVSIPVNLPAGFSASRVGVMAVEADAAKTSYDITAVTVAGNLATFQVSSFTRYGAHDEGEPDGGCSAICGGDAACGASDGCGGTCTANCMDAGCSPSCDEGTCGTSDGCGGTCPCPDGGTDTGTDGGTDGGCSDSNCSVYEGLACCGPSCVNVATDINHCGSCDNNCTVLGAGLTQLTCSDGHCYCGPTGQGIICPDGTCSTLLSDPQNCGSCGNVCSLPNQDCFDGVCSCPESQTLCGQPDAGVPLFCINTTEDALNCGACGNACDDTYATNSGCRFGICACNPGITTLCGTAGTAGATCLSNSIACDAGM